MPCLVVLALEVLLGDLHVDHGHSNVAVAEDLFEGKNAVWYMDGKSVIGLDYLPTVTDPNWKIVGK